MKISQRGIDLIKKYEGYRSSVYKCPAGVWTIGYGHTKGVTADTPDCTKEDAEKWLREDVESAERVCDHYAVIYRLNQNQYDALVSFTYNCGAGNCHKLTKNGTRTIRQIADSMLLYNKGSGKVLPGLVKRRAEERALWMEDVVGSGGSYYPIYTGSSTNLDEMLKAVGAAADLDGSAKAAWRKRLPIARANGIDNYTGTAQQNILLRALLLKGECKRP